jgi:phosphate transport system permease protein
LIWGSLKGALWASLFAMPLAILAALFVSEFASPRQRTWIKSCIELMAGVPTVMVGFFAFVVLSTAMNAYYARHQEYFVNGQWVIFLAQVPLFALTASAIAARLMGKKWRALKKLAAVSVAVLLCLGAVLLLGRGLEWASGSMLKPIFGVTKFMQLNGVLAGFCLGFAIIPVVFSVAEDAMKAVPQSYREASLALGGSRWETALRVVVPAALPGVYAALMLGLARAVGETMIVLMASGNTPILDFSPFTGMRTMAAAIAIETSEKARYSTGFHVLFFVGATLFAMTFVLNSVTDWIIARFKSRYRMG